MKTQFPKLLLFSLIAAFLGLFSGLDGSQAVEHLSRSGIANSANACNSEAQGTFWVPETNQEIYCQGRNCGGHQLYNQRGQLVTCL